MIVCIVGPSCAGKSTSAQYIEDRFGWPFIEGSEIVKRRFDASTHSGPILDFVKEEYDRKGKDTFAESVIQEINAVNARNKIICGFRTAEEIDSTLDEFGSDNVFILGIYANSLIRYQRKLLRDSVSDQYNYREFIEKDLAESHFGIAKILETKADKMIINESSFKTLFSDLEEQISSVV